MNAAILSDLRHMPEDERPTASRWSLLLRAVHRRMAGLFQAAPMVQRTVRPALAEWRDPATGLFNHDGLIGQGAKMLQDCRSAERPLGMAVFDLRDLIEVQRIYGRPVGVRMRASAIARLDAVAGSRGLVARSGKAQYTVLLPGADCDQVHQLIRRGLGHPARIELDAQHEELMFAPDFLVENVASGEATLTQAHQDLCRDLAGRQRQENLRRYFLQRERERHSRPADLSASRTGDIDG